MTAVLPAESSTRAPCAGSAQTSPSRTTRIANPRIDGLRVVDSMFFEAEEGTRVRGQGRPAGARAVDQGVHLSVAERPAVDRTFGTPRKPAISSPPR